MSAAGWIWLGVFTLFWLLLLLRVGIRLDYEEKLRLTLLAGPFSIALPTAPGEKKPRKKKPEKEKEKAPAEEKQGPGINKELLLSFLPLLKKAMAMTRRRVHISPLQAHIIFGGPDPADVAERFGQANALLWPLLSLLEENVTVRQRDIRLDLDFNSEKTRLTARVGVSMLLGDGLAMVLVLGVEALKILLRYRRAEKQKTAAQAAGA